MNAKTTLVNKNYEANSADSVDDQGIGADSVVINQPKPFYKNRFLVGAILLAIATITFMRGGESSFSSSPLASIANSDESPVEVMEAGTFSCKEFTKRRRRCKLNEPDFVSDCVDLNIPACDPQDKGCPTRTQYMCQNLAGQAPKLAHQYAEYKHIAPENCPWGCPGCISWYTGGICDIYCNGEDIWRTCDYDKECWTKFQTGWKCPDNYD
mmetsp:Transcript_15507/g.17359  ORF Transcript_15507/g.17359 Transcript_15507/m.17359 type:complete len:211 (-) Transcript_15507:122-754(-)